MASPLGSASPFLASLRFATDDFSCQVSSRDDPMFWIRIELPVGDSLLISDLNPGALPRSDVAEAVRAVLALLPFARRIVLLDILPAWQSHPTMRTELERRSSALRDIFARALGRPNDGAFRFELREERGKLNLHFDQSEPE